MQIYAIRKIIIIAFLIECKSQSKFKNFFHFKENISLNIKYFFLNVLLIYFKSFFYWNN